MTKNGKTKKGRVFAPSVLAGNEVQRKGEKRQEGSRAGGDKVVKLGSWFILALFAWSLLPEMVLPEAVVKLPRMIILGYVIYILFGLTTRISIWTATKTIMGIGFATRYGVEAGSRALEGVKIFAPAPTFSFSQDTHMVMMSAVEHRTDGQRGFTQQREQGGGDDEDGDGNHAKVEDQDGRRHEPRKLTWNEILQQLQVLKREFYEIKNSKQTGDVDAETS